MNQQMILHVQKRTLQALRRVAQFIGMAKRMGMLYGADGTLLDSEGVYSSAEVNDIVDVGDGFLRMSDDGRCRFVGEL